MVEEGTLKSRRKRRKMLKGALVLSGLSWTISDAADPSDNALLRRKRLDQSNNLIPKVNGLEDLLKNDEKIRMEDLWDQAAAAAQLDLEEDRLLRWSRSRSSDDFSMVFPTRAPNVQPTRSPNGPPVDCLQGRTREEYIFDLVVPITDANLLNDPNTPQGAAFNYLANNDPFLQDPCISNTIEQRYGLTTLYYSTSGETWMKSDQWLGNSQECQWFGVECNGGDPDIVTSLDLTNNNLIGSLTDEISTLDQIEELEFFANTLTGRLPQGVSELKRLFLLDLEQNLLSGLAFPNQFFDLPSLLAYRVSDNFLSGTIPTTISSMPQLQQLWLSTNQITGTVPTQLAAPINLHSLFLYENLLQGPLPTQIGTLTSLEDLRIQENTLQNAIPSELFALTKLESLQLEFNFFSGTLPTEVGRLTLLTDLRVDTNSLSGTLPTEIGNMVLLENLVIHNNFFSGPIPNIFGRLDQLDFVDFANNLFSGPIPESIFQSQKLRLLYLSNNTLSGSIPPSYADPPKLRDLYLDGNGLTGTVPAISPGQLLDLDEFLLHFNFLVGTMPASICALRNTKGGRLIDLFSDCGGQDPEILCQFSECCNRCFEGGSLARRKAQELKKGNSTVELARRREGTISALGHRNTTHSKIILGEYMALR